MTARQEHILLKVQEGIDHIRNMMDDVLFRTDPLKDDERKRIREAYDLICKANDKL